MPALSLSLIGPALEQLQDLPAGDCVLLSGQCPGLLEYLERVPDPRDPRGVRHSLSSLLLAAVAAVLAGARSFTAIGEWVADAPPQVLGRVWACAATPGVGAGSCCLDEAIIAGSGNRPCCGPRRGAGVPGCMCAAGRGQGRERGRDRAAAAAAGGRGRQGGAGDPARQQRTGRPWTRWACPRSVCWCRARPGELLGMQRTNQVTKFVPLLEALELPGRARIMPMRRRPSGLDVEFVDLEKRVHHILVVKKERQPGMHAEVKNLPRRHVSAGRTQHDRWDCPQEQRTLQVTAVAGGTAFGNAAQAHPPHPPVPLPERREGLPHRHDLRYYLMDAHEGSRPGPARRISTLPLADRGNALIPLTTATAKMPPRSARATGPGSRVLPAQRHRHLKNGRRRQASAPSRRDHARELTHPAPWGTLGSACDDRNGHNSTMPRPWTLAHQPRSPIRVPRLGMNDESKSRRLVHPARQRAERARGMCLPVVRACGEQVLLSRPTCSSHPFHPPTDGNSPAAPGLPASFAAYLSSLCGCSWFWLVRGRRCSWFCGSSDLDDALISRYPWTAGTRAVFRCWGSRRQRRPADRST